MPKPATPIPDSVDQTTPRTCKACGVTKTISDFYYCPSVKKPCKRIAKHCKECVKDRLDAIKEKNKLNSPIPCTKKDNFRKVCECAKCTHIKRLRSEANDGRNRRRLYDSYIRNVFGITDPMLIKLKRDQMKLKRATKEIK